MFQLFLVSPCVPPILVRFFLAGQRGVVCFPEIFILIGPNVIEILELTIERPQNQNAEILTNGG